MPNLEELEAITWTLSDLVVPGGDCTAACDKCPYHDECLDHELWWGCRAWEHTIIGICD